jgi:hypothetical protein
VLYQELLEAYPLTTKAVTSGVLFGVGDAIAQIKAGANSPFDTRRISNYVVIGLFAGILWAFWYAMVASWVTAFASQALVQVLISIVMEQFLWCPFFYSLYVIPLSTFLNGGGLVDAQQDVRAKLYDLLVANAKLWTFANLLIYSLPLEWRVLGANVFELIWASICADVAADCGGSRSKASDAQDGCSVP